MGLRPLTRRSGETCGAVTEREFLDRDADEIRATQPLAGAEDLQAQPHS